MLKSRQQTLEVLIKKSEDMVQILKLSNPEYTLDDLCTLAVITIMHASHLYPDWDIAAKKLVADKIDSELGL